MNAAKDSSQLNALRVLRSIHFKASQILRSFLRSSYSRQFMFLVCQLFLGSLCTDQCYLPIFALPRSPAILILFKMSDNTSEAVESVTSKKRKHLVPDSESKPKKSKVNLANVKNKLRRQELFKNLKHEKNKEKRERRKKQRKDEDWEQVRPFTCLK